MKKNILFAAFCFLAGTANAQFTFFDPNLNIQFADIVAVDIDNDGDLDVVASGETRTSPAPASAIFINNGGTFSKQTAANVIVPGHFADIKFGDLDGDGDLDVIFNGDSNGALGRGIALNNGSGVFTRSSLDVTNATISCGFADLDNDALLDYYAFGNGPDNQGTLFLQNDNGSFFVDRSSFANLNLNSPDVSVLDFNRDGYPDLFILATDNAGARYSAVWVNDGFGRFSAIPQPNLVRKGQGTATWGDVDGDGWLDLLLNGDGGTDNEASSDIYRLYRNNNGILESKATFSDFRQINVGDGSRMVDWDNDGDLDIL
ncbi:MAG TPA: VCBS repeat-containing protein, partial [Paludibacter sp.]|nr:VCBS repeat-containing protein [Paludibacter sp.]